MIEEIKNKALNEDVPIIKDGGLIFLLDLVKKGNYKSILELGTAVAYSAINMAKLNKEIQIDTIEKKEEMYLQAIQNVEKEGLKNQIHCHLCPIEEFKTSTQYDFIFVDAAKAQYGKYLEQFLPNLKEDGVVLFDNMVFHGLIYEVQTIESKNLRKLVEKIVKFRESIKNDSRFDIMFYDDIGDGLLLLKRRKQ